MFGAWKRVPDCCMGDGSKHSDLTSGAGRRLAFAASVLTLSFGWIAGFLFLRAQSRDFIVARRDSLAFQRGAVRPLAVPSVLRFARGEGGEEDLGSGWSSPEPDGTWSVGHRALLVLGGVTDPPSDLLMLIDWDAFVVPRHPRIEVSAYSGGARLAAWSVTAESSSTPVQIRVPRAQLLSQTLL